MNELNMYLEAFNQDKTDAYIKKLVNACESVDDIALANFYVEEATGQGIGSKIADTIKKIICNLKVFMEKVIRALETAKIKAALKCEAARSSVMINWNYNDKAVTKYILEIIKVENKCVSKIRKIHDDCMNHKISAAEASEKMNIVEVDFTKQCNKLYDFITRESVTSKSFSGTTYTASVIGASLTKIATIQKNAIEKSAKDIYTELEKSRKEAEALEKASKLSYKAAAAAKKAGTTVYNSTKGAVKNIPNTLLSLKSTMANILNRFHRETTQKITMGAKLKATVSSFLAKVKATVTKLKNKITGNSTEQQKGKKRGKYVKEDADLMAELGIDESYFESLDEIPESSDDDDLNSFIEECGTDYPEDDSDNPTFEGVSDDDFDRELRLAIYGESGNDFFTEGVHSDMNKAYKKYFSDYKTYIKKAKSSIESKKFDDAVKAANEASKAMKTCKKTIENIDPSILESIFGFILGSLVDALQTLIVSLLTFGIGAFVVNVKNTLSEIIGIYQIYKKKGFDISMIDLYKDNIIGAITILIDHSDKIAENAKQAKKIKFTESVEDYSMEADALLEGFDLDLINDDDTSFVESSDGGFDLDDAINRL